MKKIWWILSLLFVAFLILICNISERNKDKQLYECVTQKYTIDINEQTNAQWIKELTEPKVYSLPQRPIKRKRESTSSFQARLARYEQDLQLYNRQQRREVEQQRLEQINRANANKPAPQPVYRRSSHTYQELLDMVEDLEARVDELQSM